MISKTPATDPSDRSPEEQEALDKSIRNSTSREQAKQRRLNGDTIKDRHRRQVTLEDLPLFASEMDISVALMGPGRYTEWRGIVPLLERRGFPKIDGLMGGRYTPAVRAFFDREYGIHGQSSGRAVDGPERFGSYQGRTRKRKPNTDT
ncbi:hypothetical protein EI171_21060 [Bradyrhizobium sp. LCT2]|uniref:hypothetical protein n=1 Tax=Bradyrhizobium sp. LCT2 TaxID=2493093 RepID=UPI001373C439|nr:hypothetical protein [Bradyrhizobium sp. LCT2]QHP69557.1 hypothetical protein EI171_21060 [Bradyrhizobium sp. LCT2]